MCCSILAAMDGVNAGKHSVRIFTTNEEIKCIDDAFLRPGRIDRIFDVGPPSREMRGELIRTRWSEEILANVAVDKMVDRTEDWSFAQLEALKGALVINCLLTDLGWDLDAAINEVNSRDIPSQQKTKAGFAAITEKTVAANAPVLVNGKRQIGFSSEWDD